MKTLIVSLNAKYIHSSLAPWYLKSYCGDQFGPIKVLEFTINESLDAILASIYMEEPCIVAFSCYIWNISQVMNIAENLKKVLPDTIVILGGPEVSFDPEELMSDKQFIDYIISGEGERPFKSLLSFLSGKNTDSQLEGITYRNGPLPIKNEMPQLIHHLDSIPSPYTDGMLASLKDRIVYFESSRGCPFSCSYCISSTFEGVRCFSLERVKSDIMKLIEARVRQIKFVDRTFNCNKERAKAIFHFILEDKSDVNYHFEAAADLFDHEMLSILSQMPSGKIQLEIGIQSTNESVLKAVARKTDTGRVLDNIRTLTGFRNIHLHVDLIAGLPFEELHSFKNSFNEVYHVKPDNLQLGFLKMLKGSRIREEASFHGYKFKSDAPYEILENRYLTYMEVLELKGLEELVERYYNSGRFENSLEFLIQQSGSSPYDFYAAFLEYNKEVHALEKPLSSRELYKILLGFTKTEFSGKIDEEYFKELLKFDFLSTDHSNNLPEGIERQIEPGFKDKCFEFLRNEANVSTYIPHYKGVPSKQTFKAVHFERFNYDICQKSKIKKRTTVVLFNYYKRDKVTGCYESFDVTENF